ncbi:MAG: hypothetical protein BWY87_00749 [Deltaproteobacteria bacterium ADurb.Bin510]|nr:MAG: hypothetical protein BWY87_00749 [Deltaproteobacteria bacterium ADurb.Bin510]
MSKAEKIKAITKRMQSLPTLPQVVKQFTAMVENPDVTAHEVGRLISSDQVLAGKVLRLANSPFYGFPWRISSVSHAIILLGFDVIKGVVLSASVFDIMEQAMLGLWEHSLASAVVAGTLCRELGLPDAEEVSTAALLHDIGKVLVKVSLPDDYEQVAALVSERQCSFREAELEVLGVDHGDIGAWLAKEWNLPEKLAIPINYHHNIEAAHTLRERIAVVQVADAIARAFGEGYAGDPHVPAVASAAWDLLDLDRCDLNNLMRRIREELDGAANYSLGG